MTKRAQEKIDFLFALIFYFSEDLKFRPFAPTRKEPPEVIPTLIDIIRVDPVDAMPSIPRHAKAGRPVDTKTQPHTVCVPCRPLSSPHHTPHFLLLFPPNSYLLGASSRIMMQPPGAVYMKNGVWLDADDNPIDDAPPGMGSPSAEMQAASFSTSSH